MLAGFLLGLAVTARLPLDLRRAVLHPRGRRRLAGAAPRLGGRGRRSSRWRRCSLYTYLTTGSLAAPGLRLPVPAGGQRLPDARLQPRLVRRGPRATSPRTSGSCSAPCRSWRPTSSPTRWASATRSSAVHRPGRQRSLFDPDCPLVMPIDIGTSILLSAPGPAARAVRVPAARRGRGSTIGDGRRGRRDRAVQPRPLQPGLGPVGLPVLARLHALPPADGRAGRRATSTAGRG